MPPSLWLQRECVQAREQFNRSHREAIIRVLLRALFARGPSSCDAACPSLLPFPAAASCVSFRREKAIPGRNRFVQKICRPLPARHFSRSVRRCRGRHENKLLASKYAAVGSSRQQHAIKCVFAAGISTRRVISRSICAGRRNLSLCFRKPPSPALLVSSSPRRRRKQGKGRRGKK